MKFDIILIHAPSVYDFRNRDDLLFAYLSNSGGIHVSSIFEMPPVGMFAIKQHLQRCGFEVEFFNVASQMLQDPNFDVELFFQSVSAGYLGVDLHWLVHAHGALELTELYKEIHPSSKVIVGGITSTYFHEELITYPQVDYVVRGYDTLLSIESLLKSKNSINALSQIPNLTWKDNNEIHVNEMTHIPSFYNVAVDWSELLSNGSKSPYSIIIPQAGCEYNCRFCGGSRYFFNKYMGRNQVTQKTPGTFRHELESITRSSTNNHTITTIDFWHENPDLFKEASSVIMDKKISYIRYSLHQLPSSEKIKEMSGSIKAVIELSPDSHDLEVARASGRGKYTMDQMEKFIDNLHEHIYSVEIYFMIGLPLQTLENVWNTIDYCEHILKKYNKRNITPFICPMVPFLDPGSEIFDHPDKWGYTIFYHTLREYRDALLSMNWKHRINYETKWMTRDELLDISYDAVRHLTLLKKKYGKLPAKIADSIVSLIDDTKELLKDIDSYQSMDDDYSRPKKGLLLKRRILKYNNEQFKTVKSQQRPIDLGFAERQWFDTSEAFERLN